MSIRPFGAYCRVRGLDFYGDGFHLLESSLSVSTSLHLPLPTVPLTQALSFHLPSCASMCDLSPDWISEVFSSARFFSFSSPCPPSSSKPTVCLFAHIRINMIPCDIFQMPICLLTHMYKITLCIFSSVLLYLSVGFSQRQQRGCNGESLTGSPFLNVTLFFFHLLHSVAGRIQLYLDAV